MTIEFVPIRVIEVDLDKPVVEIHPDLLGDGALLPPFLALVKLHGFPLGTIQVASPGSALRAEALFEIIDAQLGRVIAEHLQRDGLPVVPLAEINRCGVDDTPPCVIRQITSVGDIPFASVIIATHNRTAQLAGMLESVLAQKYPQFEVIVVDNRPTTDETQVMLQTRYGHLSHVKYVREDRPGLAIAHNTGITHAKGTILAITDDDLRVDPRWLFSLAVALKATDNVGCVTGLIVPAELGTHAQVWFEQYSRFNKGLVAQVFDMAEYRRDSPMYPYEAGIFGTGANMAFNRKALEAVGGFDTAMGAGTPTCGGDDLSVFLDIILAGYRLVYEPNAIVWHLHRREYDDLRKQVFGYGVGLTAYLTRTLMRYPHHARIMLSRFPHGMRHMFSANSPKNIVKPDNFPKELNWLEWFGLLCGPFAYLRSRWKARTWSSLDAYITTSNEAIPVNDHQSGAT